MLYDRLKGGRSPGDNGIITPQGHPAQQTPAGTQTSRYMTISTLSSTSVWNSTKTYGSMSGTGDGDRTICSGHFSITQAYGYLSFTSGAESALFGFSPSSSISSAASNGSGDIAVFVGSPSEYINISSAGSASFGSDSAKPCNNRTATSNGLNDRMLMTNGYQCAQMYYWTISTRSDSVFWGNGIDNYGLYSGNPVTGNDINNRVVWANGVCGEDCPTSGIRFSNMSSIGSCSVFGNNTFSSWSPYSLSNGTNEMGIFGGGAYYWVSLRSNRSYINISTVSNATEFANLEVATGDGTGACSNSRQ